ncbi:hypothetical protein EDB85DRAFT_1085497 [Lactarius pseudohatsudake]|nr:hypothetical protein EDB85DRAFT_1085497 [Lactarius pseudohatsudake]
MRQHWHDVTIMTRSSWTYFGNNSLLPFAFSIRGSLLQPEVNPYPNHGFPRVSVFFSLRSPRQPSLVFSLPCAVVPLFLSPCYCLLSLTITCERCCLPSLFPPTLDFCFQIPLFYLTSFHLESSSLFAFPASFPILSRLLLVILLTSLVSTFVYFWSLTVPEYICPMSPISLFFCAILSVGQVPSRRVKLHISIALTDISIHRYSRLISLGLVSA